MDVLLEKSELISKQHIVVSGSKSETNRLLLLQVLYPELQIHNASSSDDSTVMLAALNNNNSLINIHHAGTAMRFLTAYFAAFSSYDSVVLTGSSRMKERPIKILVDALRILGAELEYLENDGFPPLKIFSKKIANNFVQIDANVSSQYISALLLIAPKLENGLKIELMGEITSLPYLKMTLAILNDLGVETNFEKQIIEIYPLKQLKKSTFVVESDWSSASYFYSFIALSSIGTKISLASFKQNSLQGDADLVMIYENFGVKTIFYKDKIELLKVSAPLKSHFECDLRNAPDIAQTIAVTCLALQLTCNLTGLHTLKIKETDRLQALKNEIEKFNVKVVISDSSLQIKNTAFLNNLPVIDINTYQDHRMAMSFAPLSLKTSLLILDAEVVNKSYPNFWNDLLTIGVNKQNI